MYTVYYFIYIRIYKWCVHKFQSIFRSSGVFVFVCLCLLTNDSKLQVNQQCLSHERAFDDTDVVVRLGGGVVGKPTR